MKKILAIRNVYLFIFFVSLASILGAIYIEFVLDKKACVLCIYQRIPYLISIFICFLGYNYYKSIFWLYMLSGIFLISILLSGYHVGIENNIFQEFKGCTSPNINITDKNELLESLTLSRPSCKEIGVKFFGLSLASLNFIISVLIFLLIVLVIKNEKNK